MIVKRVPRKSDRFSNSAMRAHAAQLGIYIVNARKEDRQLLAGYEGESHPRDLARYLNAVPEKVLATRAKNFRSDDFSDQLAELDELLASTASTKETADHWVLSWDAKDEPTIPEMFDALDILDKCLGTKHCPSIEGLHGNTGNPHAHKETIRVNPETGDIIPRTHDGWDIDAAHRAIAVIASHYPKWSVTPDRLYDVRNGRLIHRDTDTDVGSSEHPETWKPLVGRGNKRGATASKRLLAKIDAHSMQFEEDTGFKSRKRLAIEEAIPILISATDWVDAHRKLARLGFGLELAKNKSGANLRIDGKTVGASISDGTAFAKLRDRWGEFEPLPEDTAIASFNQRLMFGGDQDRCDYYSAKQAFTASLKEMMGEVHEAEQGYSSSAPYRNCDPFKLMRASFPSFDDWKAGLSVPEFTGVFSRASMASGFAVSEPSAPRLQHFAGYKACPTENGIAYQKVGQPYSRPAIFDAGKRVYVNDGSDDSIILALRLMSARYPDLLLRPFGPPDFLARVERLANDEGIAIQTGREVSAVVLHAKDHSEVVPSAAPDMSANQNLGVRDEPVENIPARKSASKSKEEIRRDAEQAAFNVAIANQQGR